MSENYRAAVAFATEFLGPQFSNGKFVNYKTEPTEFVYIFGLGIIQDYDDHPWCGTHYSYPEGAFAYLFMKTDTDKGAFEIASRIVTTKLLRGEPMALEERIFAGQITGGMRKFPPPEGKRLAEKFAVNLHLVMITQSLAWKFGLNLTRNDESALKDSACDAVSDALAALGHFKSPRAIKELLIHKSSQRVREVAAAVRTYRQQQSAGQNREVLRDRDN